jgi:hypothetical protein
MRTSEAGKAMKNPLATKAQIEAEKAALALERHAALRPIRETLRQMMLGDPAAATPDGRASLDRALDQWIRCFLLTQLSLDQRRPALIWIADNTPRAWYGHYFPGDIIAGDNPDNSNRMCFLDGDSAYELTGRFGSPKSAQFNLNVELAHPAGGMGKHLATLTDKQLVLELDGSFCVRIAQAAEGQPNHLRIESGRINFTVRDSRSDWREQATTLALRLVGGRGVVRAGSEEQLARIARELPDFVDYWRRFKDGFFGFPEPNRLVLPKRRDSEGGWGYIGGGRFRITEEEALIITTRDGGADYTGFQVTDPWTLRPESTLRTSSLSKAQSKRNPDGSCTYVIALQDPGIANWIDTAGLREGWFQLRWQNVPAGGDPGASEVQLVPLVEIDRHVGPEVPRADLAYRRAQISDRVRDVKLRTQEVELDF